MIDHDLRQCRPDYAGGGIVNLMSTLQGALGSAAPPYAPLAVFPLERLAAARRVLLLVIDGLGEELLGHIGPQSHLAGCRVGSMTSVYPPTTATAVTTLLSGQAPQQHGLTGWYMHFRELGTVTAVLPFTSRCTGKSLARSGIDIGSVVDCASFFDAVAAPSVLLQPAAIADSAFSRRLGGRAERVGFDDLADFTTRLQGYVCGDHDAAYVYAYWSELDRLSHLHGPSSPEVAAHFQALDAALAPVLEACADSGTLLVATADHGFLDSGPAERVDVEDHPELAEMLAQPLAGEPRSVFCYVRADCARAFEDYVTSELAGVAQMVPSGALVDAGWYGPGPAHPELRARVGDYTLQMRGRYTLRDQVVGQADFTMHGMHGGVTAAEQRVPLLLAGP